ncbi:MAG: hypothetical protein DMG70_27960 [Acidobacteria bacterium]|nr:MAG: hypothetical protein DMG70_27960 [Acidobacteriota bacterium]PYY06121.1 MAG: hypothetical protein DMG69_24335 [Acidobacteriota bacterium]
MTNAYINRRPNIITNVGSFQEEFLAFLRRPRIDYDPKYIWKLNFFRPYGLEHGFVADPPLK